MNQEERVEVIKSYENFYDNNNLVVNNLNIWPLIRSEIIEYISKKNYSHKNSFFKSLLFLFVSFFDLKKYFRSKNKNLFLIYGIDPSSKINFNNKLIHKHFDPFKEKFGSKNIKFIEFGINSNNKIKSDYLNITLFYLTLKPFFKLYFNYNFQSTYRKLDNTLNQIDHLNKDRLRKKIIDFFCKKIFFKLMLKLIKPKNIFVKSFDNPTAMALICAGNELEINTIDYQHGQQGENSLHYSNWNSVPKNGYKMLPKYFWIWEDVFRSKFDMWMKNQSFHKVIIGGNLWQDFFLKNRVNYYEVFKDKKIHVLYCLQFSKINEIILEAIRNSRDIVWHIRLHPKELNKLNLIKEHLIKEKIPENLIEFEIANNYLLEDLLLKIDVVVSEWSTSLYEAYTFNKTAITISNFGKLAYKKFIEKNKIYYARNQKELIKNIKRNNSPIPKVSKFNYDAVAFLKI